MPNGKQRAREGFELIAEYPLTKANRVKLARAFKHVPRVDLSIQFAIEGLMGGRSKEAEAGLPQKAGVAMSQAIESMQQDDNYGKPNPADFHAVP